MTSNIPAALMPYIETYFQINFAKNNQELIDIAKNFPAQHPGQEEGHILLLGALLDKWTLSEEITEDSMDDLIEILINNSEIPFGKLNVDLYLRPILQFEIKNKELILLIITNFKDNKNVAEAVEQNNVYKEYINLYKKAVYDFNKELNSYIEELEFVESLEDIIKITDKQQQLKENRQLILETYPENTILPQLKAEKKLLKISQFTDAVHAAEKRIEEFDNAKKNKEEKLNIYADLCNKSDSEPAAVHFAWRKLRVAIQGENDLLFSLHEKKHNRQKAQPAL